MFENWEELKENCLNCRKCSLCEARSNVVFGVGNPCAKVMFIGEGPGRNEDLQAEPQFLGIDHFIDLCNPFLDIGDPSHINAAIMPTSASNTNIISKFILSIDN